MDAVNKMEKIVYKGVLYVASTMFVGMVSLCVLQVLCRYVFQISLSFTEELARYLFIWITFLGSVMALNKNKHVKMQLLVQQFPFTVQKIIRYIVFMVTMTTYGVLIYSGLIIVNKTMQQTSAAMNLPMGFVYMAVPISVVIMVVIEILKFMEYKKSEE